MALYVGIDVSKEKFDACGIGDEGKKLFSLSFPMNREGFDKLVLQLTARSTASLLLGMESTASYHIALFSYLTAKGYRVAIINPLLIANFAKLSLRKTKTDKKDAMTIARVLMEHHEEVSHLSLSQDQQDLRDLSRERESLCHLMAATKVEIKRVLRATFPELESIGNLYTRVMLRFLQRYPSARLAKAAKPRDIAKVLKGPYVGNKLTFCAEEILRAAQSSVAVVSPAKEVILQGKISTLLHLEGRLEEVTKLLTDLCKATRIQDLEILTSIKGVSTKTAAPFLAEMGQVGSFPSS